MYDAIANVYGVMSIFTGAFMLSQTLQFHKYWIDRSKEYKQASAFMLSENCQNPLLRAHLGKFNRCEEAEEILGRYPIVTALHDVATDLNICGHNRCHIFYMDVTQNLPKLVVGIGILSLLGVWLFRKNCADNRRLREIDYYTLPSNKKTH